MSKSLWFTGLCLVSVCIVKHVNVTHSGDEQRVKDRKASSLIIAHHFHGSVLDSTSPLGHHWGTKEWYNN